MRYLSPLKKGLFLRGDPELFFQKQILSTIGVHTEFLLRTRHDFIHFQRLSNICTSTIGRKNTSVGLEVFYLLSYGQNIASKYSKAYFGFVEISTWPS